MNHKDLVKLLVANNVDLRMRLQCIRNQRDQALQLLDVATDELEKLIVYKEVTLTQSDN